MWTDHAVHAVCYCLLAGCLLTQMAHELGLLELAGKEAPPVPTGSPARNRKGRGGGGGKGKREGKAGGGALKQLKKQGRGLGTGAGHGGAGQGAGLGSVKSRTVEQNPSLGAFLDLARFAARAEGPPAWGVRAETRKKSSTPPFCRQNV